MSIERRSWDRTALVGEPVDMDTPNRRTDGPQPGEPPRTDDGADGAEHEGHDDRRSDEMTEADVTNGEGPIEGAGT